MAATMAFHWAGRRSAFSDQIDRGLEPYWPQKLYYSATPFLMVRDDEERAHTCMTPASLALELGEYAETKFAAFRKHTSQAGLLDRARQVWEPTAGQEHYLLVAAHGKTDIGSDRSLFQGIVED